jgi:non-specific protein-tyrosine kinase
MMYQPGAGAKETPGLEDYLAAISRRKLLIVASLLLGLAAAWFYDSSRTPTYAAEANVLVNPTNVNSTNGGLVRPVLERERGVVASNAVATDVVAELALDREPTAVLRDLEVRFVDGSDTLDLRYTSDDPEAAQAIVNSFASAYVARRINDAVTLDAVTVAQFESALNQVDDEMASLEIEQSNLSAERARLQSVGEPDSIVVDQLNNVRSELNSLRSDRRRAATILSDAVIESNLRPVPAEVLQFSVTPTSPQGLSSNVIRFVGALFGLLAGVGVAFVLQRLDNRARESSDVELALGTSVLAAVPKFAFANRSGRSSVVMLAGGTSTKIQAGREAYRRLRSAMLFLGKSNDARTFMVTSARPGEGKSTTAVNLAIAFAQGGTTVCLVNFDLRRPQIEELLDLPKDRGVTTWLNDPADTDIVRSVDGISNLSVVPAGPIPANPGELLASARIGDLLANLASQVEVVLVDTPPVLSAADATAMARFVNGAIIVVDAHQTGTDTLLQIRSDIERAGGSVLGAVLNRDRSVGRFSLRRDRYAYEKMSALRENGS